MSDCESARFPTEPEARRALARADLERRTLERQRTAQPLPAASARGNGCERSPTPESRERWQAVALPSIPPPDLDRWAEIAPGLRT